MTAHELAQAFRPDVDVTYPPAWLCRLRFDLRVLRIRFRRVLT